MSSQHSFLFPNFKLPLRFLASAMGLAALATPIPAIAGSSSPGSPTAKPKWEWFIRQEVAKQFKQAFLRTDFFQDHCEETSDSRIFCQLPALGSAMAQAKGATQARPPIPTPFISPPPSARENENSGPDDAWFLSASGAYAGDPGVWQLESTLSGTFQRGSKQFTGPMTEVSFTPVIPSVGSRIKIHIGMDGFSNQWNSEPGEKNLSGFGSMDAGVQSDLLDFNKTGTRIGMDLSLETPTNSQAVKNGFSDSHVLFVPTLMLQQRAGEKTTLYFNVGTEVSSEGRGPVDMSFDLARALNDEFTAYFGATGSFADPSQKGDIVALEAGLILELRAGLRVGVGIQQTVSATGDYQSDRGTTVLVGVHSEFQ